MTRRQSQVGKTRPLDRRPCDTCGELIFFAFSPVSNSWRALTAEPVSDDRRAFSWVLIEAKAWPRAHLMEHYTIYRGLSDDQARDLVDDYPHHLLHIHPEESPDD